MWLQVKLSEKPCFLCKESQNTVVLKNKEEDFQGVVCMKHFFGIMQKWNGDSDGNSGKEALRGG